ncbi:MAG: spore coat protein [Firmicutes bacterium]|nr:spore coat protein [Bacillota bacterium]
MSERDMVMDALETLKHEIVDLTKAAEETSDPQLRQALIQFRNQAEQTQLEVSQIASQKGWYVSPPKASSNEIQSVKQAYENILSATAGAGSHFQLRV